MLACQIRHVPFLKNHNPELYERWLDKSSQFGAVGKTDLIKPIGNKKMRNVSKIKTNKMIIKEERTVAYLYFVLSC